MAEDFDPEAMLERFRNRASAVRNRQLPPVGGDERAAFIRQAQTDFQDYAMIGDGEVSLDNGVLTIRIDLRPST